MTLIFLNNANYLFVGIKFGEPLNKSNLKSNISNMTYDIPTLKDLMLDYARKRETMYFVELSM